MDSRRGSSRLDTGRRDDGGALEIHDKEGFLGGFSVMISQDRGYVLSHSHCVILFGP